MRKKVSLTIDENILEKSHALGINVSKACENYLIELNNAIENRNNPNNQFLGKASFAKEGLVRSPGFEPGSSTWQTVGIDWTGFRQSLEAKHYRGYYAQMLFNYAFQFGDCLLTKDFSKIKLLPQTKVHHVLCAIASLAKFLGCYDELRKLTKKYGVSWVGRSADDLIIERLSRTDDPEEVWQWIRDVKDCKPEFSEFMDYIAITGLRLSEAINSYNLIIKLTKEGKLTEQYLNPKTLFLEHFRFREIFIRSTKKAYVSFCPLELLEKIGAKEPFQRSYSVQKVLARRHIPQCFSNVREANGTFLVKYLKEVEIDVLHGRVSGSVFKTHYLNVKLIGDLRGRAAQAAKEILAKIALNPEMEAENNGLVR